MLYKRENWNPDLESNRAHKHTYMYRQTQMSRRETGLCFKQQKRIALRAHQYEPQGGKHINEAKGSICIHSHWHHCPPTLGIQTSVTPSRGLLYHVCLPSTVIKGYLWRGNLFLTALEAEKSNIKVLARCQGPIAALTQDERRYEEERKRAGGREGDHSSFYRERPRQPLINPCKGHGLMSSLPLNGPVS